MSPAVVSEELFEELVTAAVKDAGAMMLPGSHLAIVLAPHVGRAVLQVWRRHGNLEQQDVMDALARLPVRRAVEIAQRKLAEAELDGLTLDDARKAALVKYLAALPVTAQRVLRRWGDLGQFSLLFDQLPATAERMARLLPAWRPEVAQSARATVNELLARPFALVEGLRPARRPQPSAERPRRLAQRRGAR